MISIQKYEQSMYFVYHKVVCDLTMRRNVCSYDVFNNSDILFDCCPTKIYTTTGFSCHDLTDTLSKSWIFLNICKDYNDTY